MAVAAISHPLNDFSYQWWETLINLPVPLQKKKFTPLECAHCARRVNEILKTIKIILISLLRGFFSRSEYMKKLAYNEKLTPKTLQVHRCCRWRYTLLVHGRKEEGITRMNANILHKFSTAEWFFKCFIKLPIFCFHFSFHRGPRTAWLPRGPLSCFSLQLPWLGKWSSTVLCCFKFKSSTSLRIRPSMIDSLLP